MMLSMMFEYIRLWFRDEKLGLMIRTSARITIEWKAMFDKIILKDELESCPPSVLGLVLFDAAAKNVASENFDRTVAYQSQRLPVSLQSKTNGILHVLEMSAEVSVYLEGFLSAGWRRISKTKLSQKIALFDSCKSSLEM